MEFSKAIAFLNKIELNSQLSEIARKEIAPYRESLQIIPDNAVSAAVLVHHFPYNNKACFALIERPVYNGVHSGQIALPGGKMESSDKDLIDTAKREAFEEVNIEPNDVQVIGSLSDLYIPPSNFHVKPVLSYSHELPSFQKEEKEVAEILIVSTEELLNCKVKQTKIQLQNDLLFKTPYLDLSQKVVWGATAMILNELKIHLSHEITK